MGPSGSGKSTAGKALAHALGARFVDGDDLHPTANVSKMASGVPLDDRDRLPWLEIVGDALHADTAIVIACSALKRVYRDRIRAREPEAFFVELAVDRSELETRLRTRGEHFMPSTLLDSQLQTLEPLDADERGLRVTGADSVAEIVRRSVLAVAGTAHREQSADGEDGGAQRHGADQPEDGV